MQKKVWFIILCLWEKFNIFRFIVVAGGAYFRAEER